MRQPIATHEQTPAPIQIVEPGAYDEFHDSKITLSDNVARRVGNVGIIDLTETNVPNPVWSKLIGEVPLGIRHTFDNSYSGRGWEKSREWVAFQGNLSPEELALLPSSV
jgi:hypothetical protein